MSLRAVAREISAVEAALDSLDAATEQQSEEGEDGDGVSTNENGAEPQGSQEDAPDLKLQRAGLSQRLADLQATQDRLQVCTSSDANVVRQ